MTEKADRIAELEIQIPILVEELDRLEQQPEPRSAEHSAAIDAARETLEAHRGELDSLKADDAQS